MSQKLDQNLKIETVDIEIETAQENKQIDTVQVKGSNNKAKVNPNSGIKKVAFVGVDDLILVVEGDSILICNTHHSAEVKKVSQYFGD